MKKHRDWSAVRALAIPILWAMTLWVLAGMPGCQRFDPSDCRAMCAEYGRGIYSYEPKTGACTCSTMELGQ